MTKPTQDILQLAKEHMASKDNFYTMAALAIADRALLVQEVERLRALLGGPIPANDREWAERFKSQGGEKDG